METPAGLEGVCSSTARDEFTSTILAYTFYTKLVLNPFHQRVYPTDLYRACDTCQDVNMPTITMHQANRNIMEAVVKALKSYRVKRNETSINPNWVLTVGEIFDDSPGMGMRFLPGKVESFDKETTRAQAWSLHEQIEYAQDYITARNRTIAYLQREKEIAMLECKASELNKFIEAVRAGNGPPGVSFTTQGTSVFEAPSINEHRAWAGAMVDQLRSYSDTVSKLRGECNNLQQQHEAACAKSAEQVAVKKNRTIVLTNRISRSSDAAGRGIKQSRNTCHSLRNNMVNGGNKSIRCITANDGAIGLCRRNSMPARETTHACGLEDPMTMALSQMSIGPPVSFAPPNNRVRVRTAQTAGFVVAVLVWILVVLVLGACLACLIKGVCPYLIAGISYFLSFDLI